MELDLLEVIFERKLCHFRISNKELKTLLAYLLEISSARSIAGNCLGEVKVRDDFFPFILKKYVPLPPKSLSVVITLTRKYVSLYY